MKMKTKYCCNCCSTLDVILFSLNKTAYDGFQSWCKSCVTSDSRTLSGVVRKIYSAQRRNSRTRGHLPPSYSLSELRAWCFSNPLFVSIYSDWVNGGFQRDFAPSLDRLDDSKGYLFSNIQPMVWKENMVKGHNSPHINRDKLCKPVFQFSLDGSFIKEFKSAYEAEKHTSIYRANIGSCCYGRLKTAGKFIWKFK